MAATGTNVGQKRRVKNQRKNRRIGKWDANTAGRLNKFKKRLKVKTVGWALNVFIKRPIPESNVTFKPGRAVKSLYCFQDFFLICIYAFYHVFETLVALFFCLWRSFISANVRANVSPCLSFKRGACPATSTWEFNTPRTLLRAWLTWPCCGHVAVLFVLRGVFGFDFQSNTVKSFQKRHSSFVGTPANFSVKN
jgi:hypothetical protein